MGTESGQIVLYGLIVADVIKDIVNFIQTSGISACSLDYSPIKGPEGNIEYLVWLFKGAAGGQEIEENLAEEVVREAHAALDK